MLIMYWSEIAKDYGLVPAILAVRIPFICRVYRQANQNFRKYPEYLRGEEAGWFFWTEDSARNDYPYISTEKFFESLSVLKNAGLILLEKEGEKFWVKPEEELLKRISALQKSRKKEKTAFFESRKKARFVIEEEDE